MRILLVFFSAKNQSDINFWDRPFFRGTFWRLVVALAFLIWFEKLSHEKMFYVAVLLFLVENESGILTVNFKNVCVNLAITGGFPFRKPWITIIYPK